MSCGNEPRALFCSVREHRGKTLSHGERGEIVEHHAARQPEGVLPPRQHRERAGVDGAGGEGDARFRGEARPMAAGRDDEGGEWF